MTQPIAYTRQADFSDFESASPSAPKSGTSLDAEFDAIKVTIDQIRTNLAILQRDDTRLANSSVHVKSLDAAVLALFATATSNPRGAWLTGTAYALLDIVEEDGSTYICSTAHTSGTFSTDLAALKWLLLANNSSVLRAGDTMTGALLMPVGSVSAPALGIGQANTGIFTADSTGELSAAIAGVEVWRADKTTKLAWKVYLPNMQIESEAFGAAQAYEWEDTGVHSILKFDSGDSDVLDADVVITGGTSGATATIKEDATVHYGSYGAGTAAGYLRLTGITGTFQNNEDIEVSSVAVASVNGTIISDSTFKKTAFRKRGHHLQVRNTSASINPYTLSLLAPSNSLFVDDDGVFMLGKSYPDAGVGAGFEINGDDIYNTGASPKYTFRVTGSYAHSIDTASGGQFRYNADLDSVGGATHRFRIAGTEYARISVNGVTVGSGAAGNGTNALAIYNGTAPTGNITNGVLLYSEDVSSSAELKVRNENGDIRQITGPNVFSVKQGTALEKSPYTVNSQTTQAHGLGAVPAFMITEIVCLTDELGYVAGDRIEIAGPQAALDGSNAVFTSYKDATNVILTIGSTAATPVVARKDTNAKSAITAANWKITITPYALV